MSVVILNKFVACHPSISSMEVEHHLFVDGKLELSISMIVSGSVFHFHLRNPLGAE